MLSQVLSLESCSYGVCGARGLSMGRWPAGRVMYTGAVKRGSRARRDLGLICLGLMVLKTGQ